MDRRMFALKGLALAPAASSLLIAARADAGKKKRKPRRKPRPKPRPTPTAPPSVVTQTFANRAGISVPHQGPASTYPAKIQVSGLTDARVLDVTLILHEFWHIRPYDTAVMLVSPSGKGAVVMQNVGGNHPVERVVITLDDQATESMSGSPDGVIKTGTYKPTRFGSSSNLFPAPAPQSVTESALATFNGEDPNGEWKLFIVDDQSLYSIQRPVCHRLEPRDHLRGSRPGTPCTAEAHQTEASEKATPQETTGTTVAPRLPSPTIPDPMVGPRLAAAETPGCVSARRLPPQFGRGWPHNTGTGHVRGRNERQVCPVTSASLRSEKQ